MANPTDEEKGNAENPGTNAAKHMQVKYKFRELKVYASDEWMAGSTKKYRRVFDRYETTYMRVEFSFFNKLFDEADWEASIRTKSYFVNGSQKSELSNYEEKRNISASDNIVYVRHSWGTPTPGDYWRRGTYLWEAYIDEEKVGETNFYIEDVGTPKEGQNLYLDVESVRLFTGDAKAKTLPDKKYLKKFNHKETCYIWGEVNFKNKTSQGYYAEFLFNFFDGDGQYKGNHSYFMYVSANTAGQVYTAYASWGHDVPGSWGPDTYTLEVVFMDTLIATIPFQVGDAFEEGDVEVISDINQQIKEAAEKGGHIQTADDVLQSSLAELNALIGLQNIKAEVNEMVQLVRFYQETGKDVLKKFSLHSVFVGNPGTGKTTIARILSRVYKGLGILTKGHLVEVDREGLVAGYVGQTAIKTAEKVSEAIGGILFIDEAYALANELGSAYDYGAESIQVILKRMEDQRGQFGVIVAGYTANMHHFINSNPGLRSRFDKYFVFEDYTPDEMWAIAAAIFTNEQVRCDPEAEDHLRKYFAFLYDNRDEHFGNARTVRQTVSEAVRNQNLRLALMKKEDRTPELMERVIFNDVREFELKETGFETHRIGFKKYD